MNIALPPRATRIAVGEFRGRAPIERRRRSARVTLHARLGGSKKIPPATGSTGRKLPVSRQVPSLPATGAKPALLDPRKTGIFLCRPCLGFRVAKFGCAGCVATRPA